MDVHRDDHLIRDTSLLYVVPLSSAASVLGRQACGSKAFELSTLLQKGYAVPDGAVLTDASYRRVLNHVADASERLEDRLRVSPLPDDVLREVVPAFQALVRVYGSVSVRSSATAEDLADASFAGQYETVLNVKTLDELIDAIKRCWASLADPRVRVYSSKKNIAVADCRIAVLMQGMITAEKSGVAFSIHPVSMANTIVINASYGLGEAVVSGLVTPDTFEYDKCTGVLQKDLGAKQVKIVSGEYGVQEMETSCTEQSQFCLSDEESRTLAKVVQRLEIEYQHAVDVEFAYRESQLFILQVRPITTPTGGLSNDISV